MESSLISLSIASTLCPEIWESCISLLHPIHDKKAIYSCLTVSKHIHASLTCSVLYRYIAITKYEQIAQLLFHLLANPSKQPKVKILEFCLDEVQPQPDSGQFDFLLAPVPYLLQVVPNLREIHYTPLLKSLVDMILKAFCGLRELCTISINIDRSSGMQGKCHYFALATLPVWFNGREITSLYLTNYTFLSASPP